MAKKSPDYPYIKANVAGGSTSELDLHVLSGPRPYLWIGNKNAMLATVEGNALRALSRQLAKAIEMAKEHQ